MPVPAAVRKLDDLVVEPESYHLPAEKRIAGNPLQTVWMHYTDPSGKFFAGIWHSEVGTWRVAYTEEEYCHMLEGTSVITDSAGHAVTVTAGESFTIPRAFVGTWEVVTPSRKRFVVYEAGG